MTAIAVPAELRHLSGRIADADSHEMMPAELWPEKFGAEFREVASAYIAAAGEAIHDPDYPGDIMPAGADIASIKGQRAPGAAEPRRRLEAMDAMGIARQLMYPSGIGILGLTMTLGKPLPFAYDTGGDLRACGARWLEAYADWALDAANVQDRVRPVLPLHGDSPESLFNQAVRLIRRGAPAFWIASGELPGGCSPASPKLDPLWALLAESDVAITLHGGGEGQFVRTTGWREAPHFTGYRSTQEFDFDPWSMSIYHLPSQNFVTAMVLGGVFERHPALRFGVIEVGAHWVGPAMENIDTLHDKFRSDTAPRLAEKPSHYIRRNVRVTPLVYEDIGVWIERYPGIADVLCFSTDYPHPEGGRNAAERFHRRIEHLGEHVVEKFFVTNGELLLPEAA